MLCQPWAEDLEGCGTPPDAGEETVEAALAAASEILYHLSGKQFPGLCDVELRPCGTYCNCEYDACGCRRTPRVFVGYDVVSIATVDVAGTILSAFAYLLEGGWLLRVDGGAWPCCQNIGAAPGEEDTFTITGMAGRAPSELAIRAVKALAVELVKACMPGETCLLPARVTSVSRQGVSFAVLDPVEFLSNGRTGLYIVDVFLSSVNPDGLTKRAKAWSPDLPTTVRREIPLS